MKHRIWYMVPLRSILGRPPRRIQHLPKDPAIPGNSRWLLPSGENSREALLGEAEEASGGGRRVPKGHLAVYVGPDLRRFVIPASCLATPECRVLMDTVAEEFGFEHQGGLHIPCEEALFEDILTRCPEMKSKRKRR